MMDDEERINRKIAGLNQQYQEFLKSPEFELLSEKMRKLRVCPSTYGGISDAEIEEFSSALPGVLQGQFRKAASRLNFSLKHVGIKENWRELLAQFRSDCIGPWITAIVDGQPQKCYVVLDRKPRSPNGGDGVFHDEDFQKTVV